jgi:hypothetical protein
MKSSRSEWQRIVAAARQADAEPVPGAPYGFSTRVVARMQLSPGNDEISAFARFSWRALGVAALIMATTVAANFQPVMNLLADDAAALSDPVSDAEDGAI